jgi:hypothetical protein
MMLLMRELNNDPELIVTGNGKGVKIMQQRQGNRGANALMQFIMTLAFFVASCGPAAGDQAPAVMEWQLTEAKVINPGTVGTLTEGSMRSGIKIEAKAVTQTPGAIFPEGTFIITMNAFSPAADMPGQKAGSWYLRGEWTITAPHADPEILKARYNPYSVSGMLTGTVPYDPATTLGMLEAEVRLQRGGSKPRTGRMPTGSFSGTTIIEGKLTIPFIASAKRL